MITFTDAQKLACDISRHVAVTAGAGSGKTSVLVERYLWCLENNGYQVRRIVAITFTEKAAGEMLGRIRERIIERATKGLGDRNRWEDVLEKLPLANIATIHGFCQRLLREFPIEAGVDPHFEVFDEATKRICLTHLIDAVIQQRAAAYDPHLTLLADLWTPAALRSVLLYLITFRETSLPWAGRILQDAWPDYLNRLQTLLETLQRQGIQQINMDSQWQAAVQLLRELLPDGDNSKLTARCLNLLEYDAQFRTQTNLVEQLTTLAMFRQECRMITPSKKWQENGRNVRLAEAFKLLKSLYDQSLPPFVIRTELEQNGFALQQALAELLLAVHNAYQQEKTTRHVLDFDDLQERALALLEQPPIHAILAQRYDYLMVDEFQDTNQMQWRLIEKLGTTAEGAAQARFCIVGDEKQSIYMFRGAEVTVFGEVRQALRQANGVQQLLTMPWKLPPFGEMPAIPATPLTGELILAENFRSLPSLIFFLNYLFARIFLPAPDPERPYEIQHQELLAGRKIPPSPNPSPQGLLSSRSHARRGNAVSGRSASLAAERGNEQFHVEATSEGGLHGEPNRPALREGLGEGENTHPVEFLLVHSPEDAPPEQTRLDEPELVARRIGELAQTRNYADIAILLRTRTRLKEFEQALRRAGIPFVVAGGIGFYQQPEIYDLTNLLRVLVDARQDIALAGALRSPLFSFSDDQLLYAAAAREQSFSVTVPVEQEEPEEFSSAAAEIPPGSPLAMGEKPTLWEKLAAQANTVDAIPTELDPPKFRHAHTLLHAWKTQADRIPITHLLRRILDDTGLYGILASGPREIQSVINLEKLLDMARTFEGAGFQTLSDFVAYLDLLIELEEREGEAQINFEGIDAVRLMTIHAAKGLEFPVVCVPELERPFNYGASAPVYLDTLKTSSGGLPVLGIKCLDPEQNYARENTFLREYLKHLNEEKTAAEMKRLLYVACTRAKDQLVLSGALTEAVSPSSWLAWILNIFPLTEALPDRRFSITEENAVPPAQRELEIPIYLAEDYENFDSPPGRGQGWVADLVTHPQSLPGGEFKVSSGLRDSELSKILRHNLTPIHGSENEIVRMNPSSVYTLWQCPRKYYYQDILKLPEFIGESAEKATVAGQAPEAASPEAFFRPGGLNRGTIIHRLFEKQWFDQPQREPGRFPAFEEILDDLQISAAAYEEMRLAEAINRAQQHYAQTGLRELLARSPKIYREYPFILRLGRAELAGTIDVLFFDPQQQARWVILDYKSNEIETAQVPEEIKRHGYDLQMQMYALAVSRLFQTEHIRSLLFFTFPGCVYEAVDLSPRTLKAREDRIAAFLDEFAAGVLDCSPKQSSCEECAYRFYAAC